MVIPRNDGQDPRNIPLSGLHRTEPRPGVHPEEQDQRAREAALRGVKVSEIAKLATMTATTFRISKDHTGLMGPGLDPDFMRPRSIIPSKSWDLRGPYSEYVKDCATIEYPLDQATH